MIGSRTRHLGVARPPGAGIRRRELACKAPTRGTVTILRHADGTPRRTRPPRRSRLASTDGSPIHPRRPTVRAPSARGPQEVHRRSSLAASSRGGLPRPPSYSASKPCRPRCVSQPSNWRSANQGLATEPTRWTPSGTGTAPAPARRGLRLCRQPRLPARERAKATAAGHRSAHGQRQQGFRERASGATERASWNHGILCEAPSAPPTGRARIR